MPSRSIFVQAGWIFRQTLVPPDTRAPAQNSPLAKISLVLATLSLVALNPASAWAQNSLAKWTDALKSTDERARVQAIDALGAMGPEAKAAVPELIKQLGDKSTKVRAHTARALDLIGPSASAATGVLCQAVSDPDPHVRRMAILALEHVHPDAEIACSALGKALADKEPAVRIAALSALTNFQDKAVPVLVKALEDPQTRYWAALALGEIGPNAKDALDGLVKALDDKNPIVRREALVAIAHIGPEAAKAVPDATKLVADPDPAVGHAAAFALGHIGPAASSSLDTLRPATESKDLLMRAVSSWAVARIEPTDEAARSKAIAALIGALEDKNPRVQTLALRGLMELKASQEQLLPALSSVIAEGDVATLQEALTALSTLGDAAVPALIEALKRPEVRARAEFLLAQIGPKASAAVGPLAGMLSDNDPEARREALHALAMIGPDSASAEPNIARALDDADPMVRSMAAYALGRVGDKAKIEIPKLQRSLEAEDPVLRVASAWALVHLSKDEQIVARSVPVLIAGLQNPNPAVRRGAADALGMLGKAASQAQGPLKALSSDPDPSVRKAAMAALERLGGVIIQPRPVPKR